MVPEKKTMRCPGDGRMAQQRGLSLTLKPADGSLPGGSQRTEKEIRT
ncbi:MAG: hypothetical protein SPJ79_05730 [Prevotella sp.]|nr:hypothetical protein [Bacteroidales bacterium]MDY5877069.1 hypothetical protein [Prevotella sp.]